MKINIMLNYESFKVNANHQTVQALLDYGRKQLSEAFMDNPEREALEILSHVTGLSKATLIAESGQKIRVTKKYFDFIKKRANHYPLQYLLGTEYFGELLLCVGPGVLIPRPETELIVDKIRKDYKREFSGIVVDLCTGSGNLALSLGNFFSQCKVIAVDLSKKALYYARKNRKNNQIDNVRFYRGMADQAVPLKYYGKVDIVVSNPPYINTSDIKKLQAEVQFEPEMALDGGRNGLKHIKVVIKTAFSLLKLDGMFFCEIGIGQSDKVIAFMQETGFSNICSITDWQNIPRIISGQK